VALDPGTRLGPYEVLEPIGAGGMGEVYKAKDSRLERTVAIKVLPDRLAENIELKQRFEREAKAISQLNHPHICTLHDVGNQDGVDFLVMELIDGETLADRLERGPLATTEAVTAAIQIAAALDEAHRHGIVHRDLKPGNIVVTDSGLKLLDFGLAKLASPSVSGDSSLQTEAKPITSEGAILGTFQYMAPEQLEGEEADARTDLFALGVVLYEMLTGTKAFEGKTQASLIAAILEREPASVSSVQPLSPRSLDRIVSRCLAKDPAHRWESARDVREVLSWVETDADARATSNKDVGKAPTAWLPWAIAAAAVIGATAFYALSPEESTEPEPLAHFTLDLPEEASLTTSTPSRDLAVSPDGETIAYSGQGALFVRRLGDLQATRLGEGEGGSRRDPFFSPDNEWVGYVHQNTLKTISVRGGPATSLYEFQGGSRGTSWGSKGTIVLANNDPTTGLLLLPDSGGEPEVLTTPDPSKGERAHRWPEFLPDGETVLFDIVSTSDGDTTVAAVSVDTGEQKVLLPGGSNARYASSGHIVYVSEGALRAVRFDPERLELIGNPFPLTEAITQKGRLASGAANISISNNGTLVYNPNPTSIVQRTLAWVDRDGRLTPLPIAAGAYGAPSLSPDGKHLALSLYDEDGRNIWVYDVERGTLGKRTFGGINQFPVWTPDGEEILYSEGAGFRNLARLRADGSSGGRRIEVEGLDRGIQIPTSWSDIHRVLLFQHGNDIWKLSLDDESIEPFISREVENDSVREARFSPDQNFVAYRSRETGRGEVYVVPYPGPGGKWQISTDGGAQPMWAHGGGELFYKSGDRMMAVTVSTEPTFEVGSPRVVFESTLPERTPGDPARYAVSADGQRFLITAPAPGADDGGPEIHVILNWFQELERRSPNGSQ